MIAPFTFDRSFEFDLAPVELWGTLTRTDDFAGWWPWLRSFDTGGRDVEEGVEAACEVRGPLPYSLRFTVAVNRVVPAALIETNVDGDIRGPARLELSPAGAGSLARLVWAVQVVDPALRATARIARPLMEWGHDRVVSRGVRTFRARALNGAG